MADNPHWLIFAKRRKKESADNPHWQITRTQKQTAFLSHSIVF